MPGEKGQHRGRWMFQPECISSRDKTVTHVSFYVSFFWIVSELYQFFSCFGLCLHFTRQTILTYVSMLSIIFLISEFLDFNRFPINFFEFPDRYTMHFIFNFQVTNIYVYTSLLIPTCKLIHDPNNVNFDPEKSGIHYCISVTKYIINIPSSCLFLNSNIICVQMLLEFTSKLR